MKKTALFSFIIAAILSLQPAASSVTARGPIPPPPVANVSNVQTLVSITAQFDHSNQSGSYRTILSSGGPLSIMGDQGQERAVFNVEPGGSFAIVSWETTDINIQKAGPAVISIANANLSEQDFNFWIERGDQSGVNPNLEIPLGPPLPPQQQQPGQNQLQFRVNSVPVRQPAFVPAFWHMARID